MNLKYIDRPYSDCFVDRRVKETNLEPIDVTLLTLDAENFIEKCLHTVYREIPVNRLLVCDGGSKDQTASILNKFPRVELHTRPDIRTTGKALEFLISLVETKWLVMVDADIELSPGWYDEMLKNTETYDVLENSKRIMAYHFYREDPAKLNPLSRAYDICHLVKKSAVANFQCDDDYMWRYTDILLRQAVEKSNHKYGKIDSALHVHNETERVPYESDTEKNYWKVTWDEPRIVITDEDKAKLSMIKNAKAAVKYLDPEYHMVKNDEDYDLVIRLLEREWIANNGPAWLARYEQASKNKPSRLAAIKALIYRKFIAPRKQRAA